MKTKIRIIDLVTKQGRHTEGGKVVEFEVPQRDRSILEAQLKYRSSTFVDRKKRSKNGYVKHKNQIRDYE